MLRRQRPDLVEASDLLAIRAASVYSRAESPNGQLEILLVRCPAHIQSASTHSHASIRNFELSDALLPNTYLVVRLDGKGFHRFSDKHKFRKPNDRRALDLMNTAARLVMQNSEFGKSIFLAFGESDEYSFCFDKRCSVFNRREGWAALFLCRVLCNFDSFSG